MPKIAGNEAYYQEIQAVMDRLDVGMHEAELIMLKDMIITMRLKEHKNHREIAEHFQQVFGMSQGAYETRLRWVRRKYVCP